MQRADQIKPLVRSGSISKPNFEVPQHQEITNYLFGYLAVIYGEKKMDITFPDELLQAAKAMYAPQLGLFTKEQIVKGIEYLKSEREKGNPDFDWPNLDRIIGSIKEASRVRALHRTFEQPIALVGHDKTVAQEAGRRTIKQLKGMFVAPVGQPKHGEC